MPLDGCHVPVELFCNLLIRESSDVLLSACRSTFSGKLIQRGNRARRRATVDGLRCRGDHLKSSGHSGHFPLWSVGD